jgi:serine/threonine protein kinase
MSLSAGTKLGPYEILGPLGAGGMGEVYRARDTRLERDVAIKVLPTSLSSDASLKQRLEREAKAVSKLSHAHICTLHDIGHQDGVDFLVMEYLEGETLEQRLGKGPLPSELTLRYAAQIADALAKAHKLGITHRDLKPSNVMLTKSGAKLMDFGLAKQSGLAPLATALTEMTMEQSKLTGEGTIVGTFQYMAPEQLEGKEADARTDIFSFGEVIYEMATSRPAFAAKSRASLIAAILTTEPPPITQLQPMTPVALERIVKKCLAKDPDERWQSASDLASELQWIQQSGSQATAPVVARAHRVLRERWFWTAAVLMALATGLAGGILLRRDSGSPNLKVSVNLPPGFRLETESALALSPDGRTLAFAGSGLDGLRRLWARALNGQQPQSLNGTEDASYPFWSPDNRFIGFFANHKLKKVEVSSGSVMTLCDAPSGRGADWSAGGVIVFAPTYLSGLYQISESGGKSVQLTTPGSPITSDRLPHFLPDGKHVIFIREDGGTAKGTFVLDLDSKKQEQLSQEQTDTRYVPPGYLVFLRAGNLMAQPFDASTRRTTGDPSIVAEGVDYTQSRFTGQFSFSKVGTGIYQTGAGTRSALTIFDEHGKRIDTVGEPKLIEPPVFLSPDGRMAGLLVRDGENGTTFVWKQDLRTGTGSRLTFGELSFIDAAWSKDGKQLAYSTNQGKIYSQPSDGSAPPALLLSGEFAFYPSSWSPDGRVLALTGSISQNIDFFMLPLTGEKKPIPFLTGPGWKLSGSFSPDGKWFAYGSDESGRPEVYVVPYPGPGGKLQISAGGGQFPNWLNGGGELAYVNSDRKLMVAQLTASGQQLQVLQTRSLFGGRPLPVMPGYVFDSQTAPAVYITPDGKRIILAIPTDLDAVKPLSLITNWTAGLKK